MSVKKALKVFKPKSYKRLLRIYKNFGWKSAIKNTLEWLQSPEKRYALWMSQNMPTDKDLEVQSETKFAFEPKISIVVPVYNTPTDFFKQMIDSVEAQSYSNWELCIADGGDNHKELEGIVKQYNNQKIVYKNLDENYGISGNTNAALELATGDYIAFLDHDDVITSDALYEVVSILQDKKHDIIYSDQDFVNEDLSIYREPLFKPDWSPDLLMSHNYISHFLVVKKGIVDKVGGFNKEYDGSQDYDFIFRCTELSQDIYHIHKILYHWRVCSTSVAEDSENKMYAFEAGKKAIEDHLRRQGIKAKVEMLDILGYYHVVYETTDNPKVSIIIPNKDHIKDLKKCLDSIFEVNTYSNFEIVICENNSEDKATFDYYETLKKEHDNIKVVVYDGDFNYSAINNFAVKHSSGDYLLFLNNDTQLIEPTSIADMLGLAMQEHVGAVGAKLLFKNNTIQHAGVVLGFGGCAGHVFTELGSKESGYMMRPLINCDYSAVTGACMMVEKALFNKVNGFNEMLKVAFNDIDFCIKLLEAGKYNVYDAGSVWYHFESLSRGSDETSPENKKRFDSEKGVLRQNWVSYFDKGDAFYNKNFPVDYDAYKFRIDNSNIAYSIDKISVANEDNKNIVYIKGWAYSKYVDKCDVYLEQADKKIDAEVEFMARPDVYDAGVVSDVDYKAGFEIKAAIEKNHPLFIVITDTNRTSKLKYTYRQILNNTKSKLEVSEEYKIWLKQNALTKDDLQKQKETDFAFKPKFSVVVPLYKTPIKYLKILVDSVRSQTYSNWELCLSDGSGQDSPIKKYLTKISAKDERIKVAHNNQQLNISLNTNKAIEISTGDYIAFADHDDVLSPDALYECAKVVNENNDIDLIYSDEDKISMSGKERFEPHFKSDFNIDMLRCTNYFCHLVVCKKTTIDKIGGLDPAFDGAQDYDFVFRAVEHSKNIYHIPKILYHWRSHIDSTANNPESKLYAFEAGKRAIQAHYDRLGLPAKVDNLVVNTNRVYGFYCTNYELQSNPKVSVVIANKDHVDDLDKCLTSLQYVNTYKNIEVVIVENNSDQEETFEYYKTLDKFDLDINLVYWKDKGFNYSSINNLGVEKSNGEYILLLNNDTQIINPNTIEHMLGFCMREDVGAVGAKLFYDDDTIQHAGVTIGILGIAGHNFIGFKRFEQGYFGRAIVSHDLSAVTAACLLIKKSVFNEVGKFDEELAVAFNDVDLCLRIRKAGYLIVYDSDAQLYHFESKSRGKEDTWDKYKRFQSEIVNFKKRWQDILDNGDPYYNVNLSLDSNDFALRLI